MKRKFFPIHLELIIKVLEKKMELLAKSIVKNLKAQPSIINSIIADIKEPWNDLTFNKTQSLNELDVFIKNTYEFNFEIPRPLETQITG